MADERQLGGVKIVAPVNTVTTTTQANTTGTAAVRANSEVFLPIAVEWAPVWFYSALAWLGQSYRDGANTQRSFSNYLVGANVDPYQKLGSTRLFVIEFMRNEFFLSIAPDADSDAPLSGAIGTGAHTGSASCSICAVSRQVVEKIVRITCCSGRHMWW